MRMLRSFVRNLSVAVLLVGVSSCKTRTFEPETAETYGVVDDAARKAFNALFRRPMVGMAETEANTLLKNSFAIAEKTEVARKGHLMIAWWQLVKLSDGAIEHLLFMTGFDKGIRKEVASYMELLYTRAKAAIGKVPPSERTKYLTNLMRDNFQKTATNLVKYATSKGASDSSAIAFGAKVATAQDAYITAGIEVEARSLQKAGVSLAEKMNVDDVARKIADDTKIPTKAKNAVLGEQGDDVLDDFFLGRVSKSDSDAATAALLQPNTTKRQLSKFGEVVDSLRVKAGGKFASIRDSLICTCRSSAMRILLLVGGGSLTIAAADKIAKDAVEAAKNGENINMRVSLKSDFGYLKPQLEDSYRLWIKTAAMLEKGNYESGLAFQKDLDAKLNLTAL